LERKMRSVQVVKKISHRKTPILYSTRTSVQQIRDNRHQMADSRNQIKYTRQVNNRQEVGFILIGGHKRKQTTDSRHKTVTSIQQTPKSRHKIVDTKQQMAGSRQQNSTQ
jgi:hypothetical protein